MNYVYLSPSKKEYLENFNEKIKVNKYVIDPYYSGIGLLLENN